MTTGPTALSYFNLNLFRATNPYGDCTPKLRRSSFLLYYKVAILYFVLVNNGINKLKRWKFTSKGKKLKQGSHLPLINSSILLGSWKWVIMMSRDIHYQHFAASSFISWSALVMHVKLYWTSWLFMINFYLHLGTRCNRPWISWRRGIALFRLFGD